MAPLVYPVGVGRMPILRRKLRPMSAVYCAEVDDMPSTELMIAIGSPLTNALGIAGNVGSQLPVAGARAAPGARSQSVDGFASGAATLGWPATEVAQVRAWASLAVA